MNWQQVCLDRNLHDLPYKIELNEQGQLIMNAIRLKYSFFQGKIIIYLKQFLKDGEVFPECAIATPQGTKVPDVVWCSDELWFQIKHEFESPIAPEICVEVLSPSNTEKEMQGKRTLYFQKGAKEVWLCSEEGHLTFFDTNGKLECSTMVPDFPQSIEL